MKISAHKRRLVAAAVIASSVTSGCETQVGEAQRTMPPTQEKAQRSQVHPYWDSVARAINQKIQYPLGAMAHREEGQALVRVVVERDGTIDSATLWKSTGFAELDQEATAVFYRMKSLPPLPEGQGSDLQRFTVELPVVFSLSQ